MKTNLTVASGNNGTLKQKKEKNMLRRFVAVMMLFSMSFIGMSFTTDDTARTNDTAVETKNDDCCTVTTVNGNQTIVITTTKGLNSKVMINGMDLTTWVNSLMAYNFSQINMSSVHKADTRMDDAFTSAEKLNGKMAVAFGKNLGSDVEQSDAEINDLFDQTIAAPLYKKMMTGETEDADAKMDESLNDDAELMKMAVLFSKSINTNSADKDMDMLLNVSSIRKTSASSFFEADGAMDKMIYADNIKPISAAAATEADKEMDELVKEK